MSFNCLKIFQKGSKIFCNYQIVSTICSNSGLTRRQKQEYLKVLARSRVELVSPTGSKSPKAADEESTDSEMINARKKKKAKKKMMIESDESSMYFQKDNVPISFLYFPFF